MIRESNIWPAGVFRAADGSGFCEGIQTMTTTKEDQKNELLDIAEQAERNYGVLSFEAADMVRCVAESAGGDWPIRWEVAIRAVQNCEPGALDSFVRLANAFGDRETPEAYRQRIYQIARAELLAEHGLPPDWSPASLPAERVPSPGSPVDGAEAPDERTDKTGYPEPAGDYFRADDEQRAERDLPGLFTRSLEIRSASVNVDDRTVSATLATETPVPTWDPVRDDVIPEVLRADGAELPAQVPLLDAHNRESMRDQLGSVRWIVRKADSIAGVLHFAEDKDSDRAFGLVREGHVEAVSAGYQILERVHVPAMQTLVVIGKHYLGPVNVVTRWRLREVSLAPLVADENAKLRAAAV